MPANRHQRRAQAARRQRGRAVGGWTPRPPRNPAARLGFVAAGLVLLVAPILLLTTIHGSRVPRGLLLLPVVGCALLIAAWRG